MNPVDLILSGVSLVASDGKEVEPDLTGSVLLDSGLDLLSGPLEPVLLSDRSVSNWPLLQPIKLIKLALEREVGDKVEHIIVFSRLPGYLNLEGVLSRKRVVRVFHLFQVSNCQAFVFESELHRLCVERRQVVAYFDILLLVQKNCQDRLSRTRVVYHLVCKEKLLIVLFQYIFLLSVTLVLEKED